MKRLLLLLTVCGLVTAFGPGLHADTFGANFTNTTGQSLANGPFTLGWSFTTDSAITVTQLAFFDDSQNGLVESHDIGLWDSFGNLLVSATVQAGTIDPLDDKFRVVNVSPTALTLGQTYFIGALFLDGNDPNLFPGTVTGFVTSGITFDANQFAAGGTLTFPSGSVDNEPAYFGPDFKYVSTGTPEPSSLILFGIGAFGIVMVRRRKAGRTSN